ncbi:hypothetical protein L5F32_05815 [Aliarcobacter butzleri]|uniref:NACHT domain-containing protein n=1 Tax=Aliarcobacter butzleri TaxID=28197 RepID=UPI001EDA1FF0|nr:hypothetical protein [Aliarcobacter butzleri]MCG3651783.1 hypothetical protein [Aliarcobacter butzleri]
MSNYIVQNMTKYLNLEHFFGIFNKNYKSYFDFEKSSPKLLELYVSKYLMVVAEPGYGKTRFFKELVLKANENSFKVFFIDAKQIKDSIKEAIEKCKVIEENISEEDLQKKIYLCSKEDYGLDDKTIICLDALDELPSSNLYSFFEQVEEFISNNPSVKVFLSCRTHHLKKIEYDLSKIPLEFITLDKFNGKQISYYLESKDINEEKIKKIKEKTKLGNLFDFLSIPRFLYYFSELIQNKNIEEIINLSRSEIFEDFIYRKIDKERDKKYSESENHTIKRVLEELALVMKIFQVSQISKDDFFTIFKELNLGNIFTGIGLIEKLCDKSLLKDNIDYLEFENQEFLDYLASKELSRFEKIEQVFFDIAVEPHLKEIYTPCFYVMPFVLEQNPNMINVILDFLEKSSKRILREEYFEVILMIDNKFLDQKIRNRIFNFTFDYFSKHNQIIDYLSDNLVRFYNDNIHYELIDLCEKYEDLNEKSIVILNKLNIIASLVKKDLLDRKKLEYIKDKLFEWLKLDVEEFKNLYRNIVLSCAIIMKDHFEWIKDMRFIFIDGVEIQYEYAETCNLIAPNEEFSIDIYFECPTQFKASKYTSGLISNPSLKTMKYICNVNTCNGIKYILEKLLFNNQLENFFKNQYVLFKSDLENFILNIKQNLNGEIISLLKEIIVELSKLSCRNNENSIYFIESVDKLLTNNQYSDFTDKSNIIFESENKLEHINILENPSQFCKKWEEIITENDTNKLCRFYLRNKELLQKCSNFEINRQKIIEVVKNEPFDINILEENEYKFFYDSKIEFICKEDIKFDQKYERKFIDNIFKYFFKYVSDEYRLFLKYSEYTYVRNFLEKYKISENIIEEIKLSGDKVQILNLYKYRRIKEIEPVLLRFFADDNIDKSYRKKIIEILPREVLTQDVIYQYIEEKEKSDNLYKELLINLIKKFNDKQAIEIVFGLIINEAENAYQNSDYNSIPFGDIVGRLRNGENKLALTLIFSEYHIEEDKKLLNKALEFRELNKNTSGDFLEEIVFMHIKYLLNKNSFEPLIEIEKFLQKKSSDKNLYSFEYRFKELKRIYLDNLSKPKHIMEAIKVYKKSKENEYITVNSSLHLLEIVKDSISNEIRNWIEVEGAYKHISELAKKDTNTNAEDFIQKSIKSQIELSLVKKGLRHTDIKIKREEQTLDDKRADFTINYGFMGQVLLELKFSHNSESKPTQKSGKDYKEKLIKYIDATSSDYGLFIIFNTQKKKIDFEKQVEKLIKLYEDKENVYVLGINCIA